MHFIYSTLKIMKVTKTGIVKDFGGSGWKMKCIMGNM